MNDLLDRLTAALADRYAIEGQLGQGGMATVYLAHDVKHNRKVAVKVLRPELSAILGGERFLKEIEVTANLQHPNILPLYDSGEADSFLYYVMPYVEGESLRDRLDREKQLAVEEAIEIARAVAGALDFAHQRGVIHRDIKPENILLQAGQALVADFGIALALSAAAGAGTRLTETGLSIGTPHYMSPEQASADRELDGRTDVYSLGAMLYEMLVGQPPFVGPSAQAIVAKILTEDPPPVSKDRAAVPPHTDAAIQMSLAKLPADRFTSAASFAAALVNPAFTRASTAMTAAPAAAVPSATRFRHAAFAVGFAVLGVIVGFLLRGGNESEPQVVRFGLRVPAGQRLDIRPGEDAPFAISPDGTLIVYAAIDSGAARSRLYIRRLDQIEGVALAGTEDAVAPFFSPDGLWVGFTTAEDEKLKKVPVTGGPPITLADDVQNQFGSGSWGDDGYIAYISSSFALSRVSGAGGLPEVLVDSAGVGLLWPSVLPGGDAVLIQTCTAGCSQTDLAVLDVASGAIDVVVPGGARGWYTESGHLVYTTGEGAVYGVEFDAGRRVVTGSPVPLLDNVRAFFSGSRLSISRSGTMIYLPGAAETGFQVVEVDRSGRETVVVARTGRYAHPRWSPHKDRIAMSVTGDDGSQIWIYDIASETLSQLTVEGDNVRPTWSPDGDRVAFYSTRSDASDLYWIPADGSGPAERVAEGEDTENPGTTFWTRDGAWIVFDGNVEGVPQENIYAVGTGDDRTRQDVIATGAEEETGAVSPNGEWVAYGSDESGQWQVYVRPFMAPGGRWLISTGGAGVPLWTSDTEVVYVDYPTQSLIAATLEFGSAVRVSERTRLFGSARYAFSESSPQYDVARDGESFLVLSGDQDRSIETEATVVLNWFTEIERRMAAQGGR
jgi:serine/threonine-protein kinase